MQLFIFLRKNIYFLEPHSMVPGVKRPGCVFDDAPSSNADVEKGGKYTSTSHQCLLGLLRGRDFTFLHEQFDGCVKMDEMYLYMRLKRKPFSSDCNNTAVAPCVWLYLL